MKPIRREYDPIIKSFIVQYREKNGAAPTLKEISAEVGMPTATVWRYLKRMHDEGTIDRCGTRIIHTKQDQKASDQAQLIPTVGSISCGLPLLAEEQIEEYVSLPRNWVGSGKIFILRANGDSMTGAGIDDGDLVVVRQQEIAEPGQIIVALIDNEEATLKTYRPFPEKSIVELVPENDAFDVQIVDLTKKQLHIQGIVVGVYKRLDKNIAL